MKTYAHVVTWACTCRRHACMYMYMCIYICNRHTHEYKNIPELHIYIHPCMKAYLHTYIFAYSHTCILTYTNACIHTHTCMHAHYAREHTRVYKCTNIRTYIRTCSSPYTYIHLLYVHRHTYPRGSWLQWYGAGRGGGALTQIIRLILNTETIHSTL